MARAPPKKAAKAAKAAPAKKAAPKPVKKAVPKKAAPKRAGGKSPEGKGGIFPWITNEPGTYAKVLKLSEVDFLGEDGNSFIGWGFMPDSVKALYNTNKKGLL